MNQPLYESQLNRLDGRTLKLAEKFLVGRDGKVLNRFAPDVTPDAPLLIAAIEAALA